MMRDWDFAIRLKTEVVRHRLGTRELATVEGVHLLLVVRGVGITAKQLGVKVVRKGDVGAPRVVHNLSVEL
jgi:hypothetical protein